MRYWWTIPQRKRWRYQSLWTRGEDGEEAEEGAADRESNQYKDTIQINSVPVVRMFQGVAVVSVWMVKEGETRPLVVGSSKHRSMVFGQSTKRKIFASVETGRAGCVSVSRKTSRFRVSQNGCREDINLSAGAASLVFYRCDFFLEDLVTNTVQYIHNLFSFVYLGSSIPATDLYSSLCHCSAD